MLLLGDEGACYVDAVLLPLPAIFEGFGRWLQFSVSLSRPLLAASRINVRNSSNVYILTSEELSRHILLFVHWDTYMLLKVNSSWYGSTRFSCAHDLFEQFLLRLG